MRRIGVRWEWVLLAGLLLLGAADDGAEARHGYVSALEPVSWKCEQHILPSVTLRSKRLRVARFSPRLLDLLRNHPAQKSPKPMPPEARLGPPRKGDIPVVFDLPWGERIYVELYPWTGPCGDTIWLARSRPRAFRPVGVVLTLYQGACGRKWLEPVGRRAVATVHIGTRTIEILPYGNRELVLVREPLDQKGRAHPARAFAKRAHAGSRKTFESQSADVPLAACPPSKMKPRIDVLVMYTQTARSLAQGEASLRDLIDSAAIRTNLCLDNSAARACIRIVGCRYTSWRAIVSENHLDTLITARSWPSGEDHVGVQKIHDLRDKMGADVVVVMTGLMDNNYGRAYRLRSCDDATDPCKVHAGSPEQLVHVGPAADGAYALVYVEGVIARLTFTHEIGHILGCCHDAGTTCADAISTKGHGYVLDVTDDGTSLCTVMSINGTRRIEYFSTMNPAVPFFDPANPDAQCDIGVDEEAECADVISATAPFVAGYRSSPP